MIDAAVGCVIRNLIGSVHTYRQHVQGIHNGMKSGLRKVNPCFVAEVSKEMNSSGIKRAREESNGNFYEALRRELERLLGSGRNNTTGNQTTDNVITDIMKWMEGDFGEIREHEPALILAGVTGFYFLADQSQKGAEDGTWLVVPRYKTVEWQHGRDCAAPADVCKCPITYGEISFRNAPFKVGPTTIRDVLLYTKLIFVASTRGIASETNRIQGLPGFRACANRRVNFTLVNAKNREELSATTTNWTARLKCDLKGYGTYLLLPVKITNVAGDTKTPGKNHFEEKCQISITFGTNSKGTYHMGARIGEFASVGEDPGYQDKCGKVVLVNPVMASKTGGPVTFWKAGFAGLYTEVAPSVSAFSLQHLAGPNQGNLHFQNPPGQMLWKALLEKAEVKTRIEKIFGAMEDKQVETPTESIGNNCDGF